MLGRQSVKVTYAHKRRRLLSSPLEVLPPDMDNLTRTQMTRRMLKRSRRVALAEQLEDKNVEHIREHLAKKIKRASNVDPTQAPFLVSPQDDPTFQTPFLPSRSLHEPPVAQPLVPEQLSPVPVSRRVMSRTSSRNLKENSSQSQILASPFSSRPGSAAPSPKHKGGGRSSRRVPHMSLHAKSRTISGVFKENARRVLRKDSAISLKDANKEPFAKRIKHQRCPSSPSTAYMRPHFVHEDWITPPKAFSRIFDYSDQIPSPGGSVHSSASFYTDQPQSCSTPAVSRLRKLPDLHGYKARTDSLRASLCLRKDLTEADDVEMMDDAMPHRPQTIHLSGNSIFSSSDEFTIGSLPATHDGGTTVEANNVNTRDEAPTRVARRVPTHREAFDGSHTGHSLAGSFVAEYDIPLTDLDHSPAPTAATRILGPEDVRKASIGARSLGLPGTSACRNPSVRKSSVTEQPLGLPGTSPGRSGNLVIRMSKGVSKSSVGERLLDLPGTSPLHGGNLVVRTSRNHGTLTPPVSPPNTAVTCPPSSPGSDLAVELQSMDICGDSDIHSDGELRHASGSVPFQSRSNSLQDVPAELTSNKSVKRQSVRNRAGTIRASDFVNPSALSEVATGSTVPPLCSVRRTRSGTVVGPDSKLAAKGAPATRIAAVQPGSESDDELLLKSLWLEDLEYLGLAVPRGRKDTDADELNLGGLWSGASRRPGLRRR